MIARWDGEGSVSGPRLFNVTTKAKLGTMGVMRKV